MIPRPYQFESFEALREGWKEPDVKNQLLCMATGTGKTIVFAYLAMYEQQLGGRTLVLAHTDELIDQAVDKIYRATRITPAREKAQYVAPRTASVVVGSVQTMQGDNRLASWPQKHFTLVIVDEAHRSLAPGYQKILKHFGAGGARVVGVTATADRGDKRALGEYFHRVAFDYGLLRAVKEGWLVRPMVKTMPITIDLQGVKTKPGTEGTDLDKTEVAERLKPFLKDIAAAVRAEIGDGKVLLFLPSVETAELMAIALAKTGINSNWVSGDRENREGIVAAFRRGEIQALSNCMVLTEGFDDDSIRNIVCLRATKIRSLYCQIVGRGTRPLENILGLLNAAPDANARRGLIAWSAKPTVRILDFLWLYEKHNLCTPASLVTDIPELQAEMKGKDGDLIEAQTQASIDLLKKLEEEVRKNQHKQSRVVDPLAIATELGDVELASYEPLTDRDAMPMTPKQEVILRNNGVKLSGVTCRGHASKLIGLILERHAKKLCTIRQLNFLQKKGIDARLMTKDQASERMTAMIENWRGGPEKLPRVEQPTLDLSDIL